MAGYGFETTDYGVVGQMPDGEMMEFASASEYEDAYYDAAYEYQTDCILDYDCLEV